MDIEQIGGTCFVIVSNIEAPEKTIESKLFKSAPADVRLRLARCMLHVLG